ncbi:MFS transporter [Streptosporangium sp. NPDC051022]|uniref:MFS transporter n=1 Tax=Streptosporangium sp. NPDC051022 TaxID=3155752 RepID=UPI00342F30D7
MVTLFRRALGAVGWWDVLRDGGPARLLAINALVDASGVGLTAICLPFYAITVAGVSMGDLALVLSVAGFCELLAAVPNGALASRVTVRTFTIGAKLVQAGACVLLGLSYGFTGLLIGAAVAGLARAGGNGLNQSLTVAVLGESERAGALGAIRALRNIGYMLAGSAGSILLAVGSPAVLTAALLANAVSFVVSAWCVSRVRPRRPPEIPDRVDFSVLRDWEYLGLIISAAVFGSSLIVLDVALPLWVLAHGNIPRPMTAVVVVVNTVLVILLQYRVSKGIDTLRQATRSIGRSAAAFAAMAAILALTPMVSSPVAVVSLLFVALALTFGELLESPSWWTISYRLAPAERKNEYLAAFDLSWAMVAIAGPAGAAVLVSQGSAGWIGYAVLLVGAALSGTWLAVRRARRMNVAPEDVDQ